MKNIGRLLTNTKTLHPLSVYIKKWESFNYEERRSFRRSAMNLTLIILGITFIAIYLPSVIIS